MLLKGTIVLLLLFVSSLSAENVEKEEQEIIDLQEILLGVAKTLKEVKPLLIPCNTTTVKEYTAKPKDCADIWKSGQRTNGVYRIWPEKWEVTGSFEVFCDMTTDGGGWTVFQKRGDFGNPKDYFFKTWIEYKNGFGDLTKEFWLGNDRIFVLSNQDNYHLRVDLWDMEGNTRHAKYSKFWIENEDQQYRIQIDGFSGDAGDSLGEHKNLYFSTKDRTNDLRPKTIEGCAISYSGAWWYGSCHSSNLNGLNLAGNHTSYADGIEWNAWTGYKYSLKATEIKIRPSSFVY